MHFNLKMLNHFKKYTWCHLKVHASYCRSLSNLTRDSILNLGNIEFNFDYLCNPINLEEIKYNIQRRKSVADIEKVIKLHSDWRNTPDLKTKDYLRKQLFEAALKIPNNSHPDIKFLKDDPEVVNRIGDDRLPPRKPLQFQEIASKLNICRTENISNYTGPRSYYFMDTLCQVEEALMKYTLSRLKKLKFELISVPDILPRTVIEFCGMDTKGERNQVYSLQDKSYGDLCLSGTAEMGIAYYLSMRKIKASELPLRITAVSRCFRAETSKISEEKGVYRVHQFTKVEMFGVSEPSKSDDLLKEFVMIQEELFSSLGLKLQTLDMPPPELGAQASRKFDIEVWLPGKKMWGEISSASNCTDYQSRRLGIKSDDGYVHTINGTACATPRLILSLLETHQNGNSLVELPPVLHEFLNWNIVSKSRLPLLIPFKTRSRFT